MSLGRNQAFTSHTKRQCVTRLLAVNTSYPHHGQESVQQVDSQDKGVRAVTKEAGQTPQILHFGISALGWDPTVILDKKLSYWLTWFYSHNTDYITFDREVPSRSYSEYDIACVIIQLIWTLWATFRRFPIYWLHCGLMIHFVKCAHLHCGFDEAQPSLFREVVSLLLIIHPQLLHQLEGVHVSGTGASDLLFSPHCRKRKHQDSATRHDQAFMAEYCLTSPQYKCNPQRTKNKS